MSRVLFFHSLTHFGQNRGRRVLFFMFYAPWPVLGGIVVVGLCFHALRSRTHFWRYGGRRVPF
jgi:hypothetical protein